MRGFLGRHALHLGALLVGLLVLFRGALFFGEQFANRDLLAYYIPAKSLVRRLTLETGGLPLWNPYFASGQPFAANPEHAMFHPITWLFLVLPFEWAMRLQVMLPVALAFFSMRFFLRVLPTSKRAALLGSLSFAFGGYLLSMTNLLPILYAVPTVPLVLAFLLRAFRSGSRRDTALLAISFGLLCLAGEPSTLLMTPSLVVAALAFELLRTRRLARRHRGTLRARALAPALGLALGALIGAAALLPAARLVGKTARAGGLSDKVADVWSMPVARLLELVWPYAFGRVERGMHGFVGAGLYPDKEAPFIFSLYAGLLVPLAAAASLGRRSLRRRPERLVWVAIAVAGIVVAAGAKTPAWTFLRHHVPLLSGLRFPEKFALLSSFSILVLASLGIDGLLHSARGLRDRFPRGLTWGASAALVALLFGVREVALLALGNAAAEEAQKDFFLDGSILVTTALAYAWVLFSQRPSRIREPLLVALLLCDLLSSGKRLTGTTFLPLSPPIPLVRELLAGAATGPVFHHAAAVVHGNAPPRLACPPLPALWGVPTVFDLDFDLTELRWSNHATRVFLSLLGRDPGTLDPLLERRGVVAVVKLLPGLSARRVRESIGTPLAQVSWLRSPRPFAFAAPSAARVNGEAGWVETVLGLGAAASGTVCLDTTDPRSVEGSDVPTVPPLPGPATVTIVARGPARIELEVTGIGSGEAPSLVAINQTWDEFWSATLDGEKTRILRVDLSLSAVVVPKGRHRLVLIYDDPWIRRGIWLSLGGLSLSLVLLRRRSRGGAPG